MSSAEAAQLVQQTVLATRRARDVARRSQSANNLKHIALGLHNYYSTKKQFPPAVLTGPDGKTLHSWRVAILPDIGQRALYEQYKFDEPWDSEHNKKLLAKMPAVFRHPKDDPHSTNTSYFALTGPETIFAGKEGMTFRKIPDGTSLTLWVVEAKRAVPWSKPEDISYAADKPLPKFGGWLEGGFNASFADGSVSFLSSEVSEKTLRAFITKAGGEIVERPK